MFCSVIKQKIMKTGKKVLIAIPSKNAIVVRLGHKRSKEYVRELTTDITRYMEIAEKISQQ